MDEKVLQTINKLLDEINSEIQALVIPATANNVVNAKEALWRVSVIRNTITAELEKGKDDGADNV